VNAGVIKLDGQGRATQAQTFMGLRWTGGSEVVASFQAAGIAAFKSNDTHQEKRERQTGYGANELYLNYLTWNPSSSCDGVHAKAFGQPCNANVGFQQHGFSTTLRDPTDGSTARQRWNRWMNVPGVLKRVSLFEHGMTIEGLGVLLNEQRLRGDKSGEFSLNAGNEVPGSNLQFYHPSAKTPMQYLASSQWQALMAWTAFFEVFKRKSPTGVFYVEKRDMEQLFFKAEFPTSWKPHPWGFREALGHVRALRGTGAGEEWAAMTSSMVDKIEAAHGTNADDKYYATVIGQALVAAQALSDDVWRTFPGGQ